MTRSAALRYALAPVCVGVAAMLQVSPLGPHPIAFFILGVITAAWVGGIGPGLLTAVLAALSLPYTIDSGYPLLFGFLDLPRFMTLSLVGAVVGWGTSSRRRAESALRERKQADMALRESEARYERVVLSSNAGIWDWDVVRDEYYLSPRLLEITGFPPGTTFSTREEFMRGAGFHPQDLEDYQQAVKRLFAGSDSRLTMDLRMTIKGEMRWYQLSGICFRDAKGSVVRWTGSATEITDRKRAEEALRQSEERYERAMLAAEAGFWDWDVPADEFYMSPKLLEMSHQAPGSKFAGRSDWVARTPIHPDDLAKWERAVKELFASGNTRLAMEVRTIHGGETRWVFLSGLCVRDADGKILRWTGSATDVTARKRAEMALRQSDERYARVMQASEDGFWEWIVASDEFYASPRMLALYGLPAETVFRGRADFLSRFPFHPQDLELWRNAVAAHLAGQNARVDIEVRAKVQRETRWIHLTAICQRDATGAEERWTGSVSDVTERRRAQEALRVSEERYSRAMDGSGAGHWDWNIVSDEMFVSERAREMLCLPSGSLPRTRVDIMALAPMHPEDRAAMAGAVTAGIQSGVHERDYRVIPRPGEVRWLRSRAKVYRDERGAAVRMTGSLIDITERKLAADALRVSEERYTLAMEASEEGHFDFNVDTDELFTSERLNAIYGFPPGTRFRTREEYLTSFRFYGNDAETYEAAVRAAMAKDGPERYEFEYRILHPSGEMRWLRTRGKVMRDAEGHARRRTGVVADITEAKLAEDALRRSEQRYALAMEAAGDGHTDWNLETGEFYISPRLLGILGYAPGTTFIDRADWVRRFPFHPEDRPRWEKAIAAHFASREAKFRMDLRIVVNGVTRWVAFTFIATRDASGKPVRWTGSIADINDAKLADQALRESQERYALAVAGSDAGVWDYDFVARRHFSSARARELAGLPPEPQALPMTEEGFAALPLHPEDVPRRIAAMQAHLAGTTPMYEGEFRVRQLDGTYCWRRIQGLCVRDADGNPLRMAGSISDIDARRRAEEALRLSEERYALALEASEEGHFDTDLETGEMFVSARLNEIYGFARRAKTANRVEFLNQIPIHPDDRHFLADVIRPDWEDPARDVYEFECRIVPRAGEIRWIHTRGKVMRDAAGRARRRVGVVADITDRKLAAEALRLSEERYALAMEAAQDAHWDWIVGTDQYYTSPRVVDVFGLPPGTTFTSRQDYLAKTPLLKEDLDAWLRKARELFAGTGSRLSMDLRARVHGEIRWIQHNGVCFRNASGRAVRWCGSVRDVTERRRAEEALRLSEKRYALAMEVADEGHFDWNVQTDEIFASARALSVIGAPPDAKYRTRSDVMRRVRYHPDDDQRIRSEWRTALEGRGVDHEFEYRILRGKAAEPRWIRGRWKVFRDANGVALRVIGIISDITERKQALETLRVSESRFRTLVELSSNGFWVQDENLRYASTALTSDVAGYDKRGMDGKTRWELSGDPTPLSGSWAEHKAELAARRPFRDFEYRRLRPDGKVGYYSASGAPIFDEQGRFKGYYGVASDITERKRVEEELRSRQEMLELAQKSARAVAFEWKIGEGEGENRWSPDLEAMYGLEPGTYDGTYESWRKLVHRDDWLAVKEAIANAHRTGDVDAEYRVVHPDGSIHWLHAKGRMLFDGVGKPVRMVGFMHDVTERKRVEEALRQSEERYALAVAGSNEGIFDWDLVSDRVYVSYRAQELFGLPRGELWRPRRDWRHIITFHPEDTKRLHDSIKAHIEGGTPTYDEEFRIVLPGGAVRWFRQRGVALRDESGKAYRVVGSIGDVTEKHIVEEELSAMERKLRLAQRLEAMGTLAGGIAHDFNNILGAILGYGEMALRDAPKGSRLHRDLDSIVTAGERGRALVDRVLAFSRSGTGERVPVHVEKVVREALDLISAKLPPDVTLHAKLHSGPAAMQGDPTQVHQVLMNLATNAVQAMPNGGTLRVSLDAVRVEAAHTPTIGTVAPTDYVVLKVADTGSGIAPEIVERIFDPFFTTKEVGTGTGLGLSLVHGIVAEVGGAIDVASKPGAGTTFTVYLPRFGDAPQSEEPAEPALPRGGGQRVLIVDDEELLVKLATRTLEELGYAPVGFTSSTAALAAFRAEPQRFDALITDERMPGLSGSALIREVRGIRDRIPIVLMSGYVGAAVARQAREAGAEEVLKKPLSARDLAASLARVLQQ